MEDILASIRRILNEDEVAPASPEPEHPHTPATLPVAPNAGGSGGADDDGVLVLDEAMLVTPPPAAVPEPPNLAAAPSHVPEPLPVEPATMQPLPERPSAQPSLSEHGPMAGLLAPESAAAAASSVGALLRTISEERGSQVHRGGPTIEDVVREEVRPLLKAWLDHHLPPMVERLVRQEIERVTGRAAP